MGLNEAETRVRLIDPALHARGWREGMIKREETAGAIEIVDGKPRRRRPGRADYVLRVPVLPDGQPVALALIEAKAEDLPPGHGLQQAKAYADAKRLNVPFVVASNGHQFVLYERFHGTTSPPRLLAEFPTPADLRARYEVGMGFALTDDAALPLSIRYRGGEASRRYYQDAAIRAVLEAIAQGQTKALLSLATGAGKTRIAVNLLRRIADAGQLRRALFVCDRDELRSQAATEFHNAFGNDAAAVSGHDPAPNARILIATYQTLGVDAEGAASFLNRHYPAGYFSHIVIDECHRSAWGKWSEALKRNADAIQIGLTATPRQLAGEAGGEGAAVDRQITADNIEYFGEPVYEYDMAQGIEDGYLAACEIVRRDIFLEAHAATERETGIGAADFAGKRLADARTGEMLLAAEGREHYEARAFERRLEMPDRVAAMTADLFDHLCRTGGPEQKTIVFCASDRHADDVANALNNRYAAWCADTGAPLAEPYAFKCTAASGGSDLLPDFRGSQTRYLIAATVDLLTTGVDVPNVRNVVFFKYVGSPIAFYQMVGRGTRIDPAAGKLMFRVYDYTNATRLFGERFVARLGSETTEPAAGGGESPRTIRVEGIDVRITDAGRLIPVRGDDGRDILITVEAYEQRLAARLVAEVPTLETFRGCWVQPDERRSLLLDLHEAGYSPTLIQQLEQMDDYDLYDVLAELGYGVAPRTRSERAEQFLLKQRTWLDGMPPEGAAAIRAIAKQFERAGTDELENPAIFGLPAVIRAGGLDALKRVGRPADVLHETKERMFAA